MDNRHRIASLKPFFEPESVAVIGASRTPGKGGYNIIENLRRLGYTGRVYPINPRAGEVGTLKAYPDLKNLPGKPELAIIVLPPFTGIEISRSIALPPESRRLSSSPPASGRWMSPAHGWNSGWYRWRRGPA